MADGSLVVDCRSAAYVAAWRPSHTPWLSVRVERDLNGKRSVVSHMAKHTRGLLAGALVAHDAVPSNADELADIARDLDHVIEVSATDKELTIVLAG